MLEISYTCSLGKLCHSAEILKRNKYKLYSCPFDWIFSNTDIIIDCMKDNFSTFLDKQYYVSKNPTQNRPYNCEHTKYNFNNNNNMFNHHDPLKYEEHYNYFVRCVDRFKTLLKKQEHKLFIMTFTNLENIDENVKNKIVEFNNNFSKYTSNYTLLVILHIKEKEQNNHIFTYNDNLHFLELHTLSHSDGVRFNNNNDNIYLDNVINSTYNFNIIPLNN